MLAIDANIFLEVFLNQQKSQECTAILERIEEGRIEAVVCDVTVGSIIFVMEREGKDWKLIQEVLLRLLAMEHLQVFQTHVRDKISATYLMRDYRLDFDDGITLHCALQSHASVLVSLDPDFDRQRLIKRVTPSEALKSIKE